MVIIGAKGFAKQLCEALTPKELENLCFFDNVSPDPQPVFERFPVIRTFDELQTHFSIHGPSFAIGIGNPDHRFLLSRKFLESGGKMETIISHHAQISSFDSRIGQGCTILSGVIIEGSTRIGEGCLINLYATVTHDCQIGDYVEISPGVRISGGCEIGDFCMIGTGAILLPNVKLGKGVKVGAGAVVTKSFPEATLLVGVPAKPMK